MKMQNLTDHIPSSRIKRERVAAGLTQSQLAELLGAPKRTIENWDYGTNYPPTWSERLVIDRIHRYSDYRRSLENDLVNYVLNNPHPIIEDLTCTGRYEFDDTLAFLQRDWDAAPCDPEGPTAEQDAYMDKLIEDAATDILNRVNLSDVIA